MTNSDFRAHMSHQQPRGTGRKDLACGPQVAPWTVSMECKVAADTCRIFTALTVPEYMEAWISVPGYHPECHNITCQLAHGFQIEHHCKSGTITRISGLYRSFHRRKLSLLWRQAGTVENCESFVDIRLSGDFDKSTLRLRHRGLNSEEEFNWHRAFWSASITRLCRLFEKPAMGTDQQGQRRARKRSQASDELYEDPMLVNVA